MLTKNEEKAIKILQACDGVGMNVAFDVEMNPCCPIGHIAYGFGFRADSPSGLDLGARNSAENGIEIGTHVFNWWNKMFPRWPSEEVFRANDAMKLSDTARRDQMTEFLLDLAEYNA